MQMRYPPQPEQAKTFTTAELRENFLIEKLFAPGEIHMVYSHIDRIITGGASPIKEPLALVGDPKTLGAAFFPQHHVVEPDDFRRLFLWRRLRADGHDQPV